MKEQLRKLSPALFRFSKQSWYRIRRFNPFISSHFIYVGLGWFFDFADSRRLMKIKPNLFMIGAEKSGTTSLHHYLSQHPDVFMSHPNKEPHYLMPVNRLRGYFGRSDIPIRGHRDVLKNHMSRGYRGEKIFGESTTAYTRGTTDTKLKIPQAIKQHDPEARCLYIIRHPIDRIISSYRHRKRLGLTELSIEEEIKQNKAYVFTGMYGRHVEAFQKILGPDKVLVVFYEEFIEDPQTELDKVFKYLNIASVSADTSKIHNKGEGDVVELPEKLRKSLARDFAPDIKKLEELIGRKVPWKF